MKHKLLILSLFILSGMLYADEVEVFPPEMKAVFRIRHVENVAISAEHPDGKSTVGATAFGAKIKGEKFIVTAAHVVLGEYNDVPYEDMEVEINGKWVNAKVEAINLASDCCLLSCKEKFEYLKVVEDVKITLIGSQKGKPIISVDGKLLGKGSHVFIEVDDFDSGNSGSPVIQKGKVIGFITAGIMQINLNTHTFEINHKIGVFIPIVAAIELVDKIKEK